jgi:hypothetical protein
MKRLWYAFRCRVLLSHRWQQLRQDEESYFECLDCKRRYFGNEPPSGDLRTMTGGGG